MEGRDVVLGPVVVGRQGRGPEQVDRPVRPDEPATCEGGGRRQGDAEKGGPETRADTADRAVHRRSPLDPPARLDRSCWGQRLRKPRPCSLLPYGPGRDWPHRGGTGRLRGPG